MASALDLSPSVSTRPLPVSMGKMAVVQGSNVAQPILSLHSIHCILGRKGGDL
jgi:hypothetical protein